MDFQDDNAMRRDDVKPTVNLQKQNAYAMRHTQCVGDNWQHGLCVHCNAEFTKKTTWQKYCSELCRQGAYEQRTGKKWYGKKSVADG